MTAEQTAKMREQDVAQMFQQPMLRFGLAPRLVYQNTPKYYRPLRQNCQRCPAIQQLLLTFVPWDPLELIPVRIKWYLEYLKVRQSNVTGSAYIAPRIQDLELRDNNFGLDEPLEKQRSELVPKLNTENSELMEENATLRQQIVKHVGMVARHEKSLNQIELELASQRSLLKTLEEEVRIGRVKLKNEIARSVKFKLAYDNLRSHPVIRAGRNLKAAISGQKLR